MTEVTRTIFAIEPLPGTQIEAAVDEGEIRAVDKDRAEPVSEVELELKGGEAAALYDLAAQLLEIAPLRIQTRSKSERGYRLVECGDAAPPAVHAEPVILDPDMTVESALKKIGRSCLAQLLRNEPAVLSAQPEGVHQMRVAVRRLRSAISSLKKILPEEDVQWVTEDFVGSAVRWGRPAIWMCSWPNCCRRPAPGFRTSPVGRPRRHPRPAADRRIRPDQGSHSIAALYHQHVASLAVVRGVRLASGFGIG